MRLMQIFPTENMVIVGRTEVIEPGLKAALLPEWHEAKRVLIQPDGDIFIGLDPAEKFEGSGLGLIDEICKLPGVAKALDDMKARCAEHMAGQAARAFEAMKAKVHPMQVIGKADSKLYWTPTMTGYGDVAFEAGDKLFSTGLAAEAAGFAPGVTIDAPKRRGKKKV